MDRRRLLAAVFLTMCLVLLVIRPGKAQQAKALAGLILNGDFEGDFYPYGAGQVAQHWVPYDFVVSSPPQFLRSTLYQYQGLASQQIWADTAPWYAGIMQTTVLTSGSSSVRIQAGKKYTVHVWLYSIYAGAGSAVQNDKIMKRVGIHPSGQADPKASGIVWTPWHGQDKTWIQVNAAVEATGNRLTIFIEANVPTAGGQDQLYIDDVWLEEEGAATPTPTSTATPLPTRTPTPTPTPAIAVVQTIRVGTQPQGLAVVPDTNRFFVANSGENTVSSLEGFLNWRSTKLPSGGDRPIQMAVDSEQCRLYVLNSASNDVAVFNACTNRQIATVALAAGQAPSAIAVLTTTNTVYVVNSATNSLAVINADTLTPITTIPVGPMPAQVAVNPRTNKVYVTYRGTPSDNRCGVTIIDANAQAVLKTIGLSYSDQIPAPGPYGVAVNSVTNRVYVATESGKLVVIDGADDVIIATLLPPTPTGLGSVAVNPTTNTVFVSSATGSTVFAHDADDERWLYTLSVGTGLFRDIAVNPLTYQVMVSNPGDDTVSIIRDFGAYQPFRLYLLVIRK